jgi:hypothetical protein
MKRMRTAAYLVAVFLGMPGAWAAADGAARAAGSPPSLCIPFDAANEQITVQAKINGHASLSLLLDTGSMGSVLDEGRAAALGLLAVGRQTSHGAGGAQEGSTVHGVDVELQGFRLPDQTMDTLALERLGAGAGRPIDGILGHTLFLRNVVEIDYPRCCLNLYDATGYVYRGQGKIVPLEFHETHPYTMATVVLPGGKSIRGRFVIDTGASSSVILTTDSIKEEGFLGVLGKMLPVQGQGVGGGAQVFLSRIDRLDLGGFSLERPIVAIQPAGAHRVSALGSIGNIGGGILSRFKVIFDYSRKRMILEPGPSLRDPFESDMSGMGLVTRAPEFRDVIVARVREGSPASEAGVRPGDEILSVDGTPAGEIGIPALRERFRRQGKDVRLVLKRRAERIDAALRTRRQI